jgi:hypothetical protein
MTLQLAQSVPAWVCENRDDVEALLDRCPTPAPTLHPKIGSPNRRDAWNGWNFTQTHGTDATGAAVVVKRWHFGSGHIDTSVHVSPPGRALLSRKEALNLITYPVVLTEPQSIIEAPQWTPGHPKAHAPTIMVGRVPWREPCEPCDGTGQVYDTTTGGMRDCHTCGGTGHDQGGNP